MKTKQKATYFLAGVLMTLFIIGTMTPATAIASKSITVFPGVEIYLDDVKLNPKDVNGNPVDVFYYNGTTYVPIRAVSEAFGYPVQWESSNRSVYIGKHSGNKPAVWLSELDYFNQNGNWYINKTTKDNLGQEHEHSLDLWDTALGSRQPSISYNLNGQYQTLTGVYFQEYQYRTGGYSNSALSIYADGEQIWKANIGPGISPLEFSLDIAGVRELEFRYDFFSGRHTALGNVGLWT